MKVLFCKSMVRVICGCLLCLYCNFAGAFDIKVSLDRKSNLDGLGSWGGARYTLSIPGAKDLLVDSPLPSLGGEDIHSISLTKDQFLQTYNGDIILTVIYNFSISEISKTIHFTDNDITNCSISLYINAVEPTKWRMSANKICTS